MRRSPLAALRRRTTALLAAAVGGALVLSGCSVYDAPLPGGPDVGSNPITVKAEFRDVLDLVPQSTVKVDDVSVGKITKVSLKGYTAVVTMELPKSVDLPDNATAQIRQTSLLGEKFVSLAPPENPSSGKLANGDVIGLDRTGRNPEVEEVFSALALLLNGGGVGQLKTIAEELNNAFDGRESDVRSVLEQIKLFVGQLDQNKTSIVAAIENTNRLAGELRQQEGTINATLDDVPAALRSINKQRDDLVRLLQSLNRLSGVGVRVIQASKQSTINSLRDLAPVLDGFAKAGQSFPRSFQVFLTYPFVDAAVGRDPQVARNLHMGDYTNLSITLNLDVADLPKLPSLPSIPTPACDLTKKVTAEVEKQLGPLNPTAAVLAQIVKEASTGLTCSSSAQQIANAVQSAIAKILNDLPKSAVDQLCKNLPNNPLCKSLTQPGGGGIPVPTPPVPSLPGGVSLPRAQLGEGFRKDTTQIDPFGLAKLGVDPGIGTMLLQGVADVR